MGVPRQKDMADAQGSPVERIEAFLDKIEALQTLQDKTGIKKLYLAAGVALVVTIIIFFGFGAGLLCNFVGFVYPAYGSRTGWCTRASASSRGSSSMFSSGSHSTTPLSWPSSSSSSCPRPRVP